MRFSRAIPLPDGCQLPSIKFANSPSDAMQCLIDLKEGMGRIRSHVSAGDENPVADLIQDDAGWHDWSNFINHVEPYYWPTHTAALVTAASASYPLELETALDLVDARNRRLSGESISTPSYLPRRARGVCVFQQPCLFITIGGRSEPLSALGWNVGVNAKSQQIWLSLRGIAWSSYGAVVIWWSDGGSAENQDGQVDATFRSERLAFTKWICTASMFIEQEIVSTTHAALDRAVRKRCARANLQAPCHVVTLRKELAEEHKGTGLTSVEWSHRWLVRGHWRRQFYPSRGGHAPTWIHPHVKGPSDKPFIEPKPTVYSVAR